MVDISKYLSEESINLLIMFCDNPSGPLDSNINRWTNFLNSMVEKQEELPLEVLEKWLNEGDLSSNIVSEILRRFETDI